MMDAVVFGAFLRECRAQKNLTQAELAGQLHVTAKAVSRWERGVGFPDIQTLEPLAKALDVSLLELMHSRRIEEGTVSSEEASEAVAYTLGMMQQNDEALRRSPLWWIYAVFNLIPVLFLNYILNFYVEIRWLHSTGYMLCLFLIYLNKELVQFLINQQREPRKFILSCRWPYLTALCTKYVGFLILAFSFAADEFYGLAGFIAALAAGVLLMLGAWLCFEFWKDYPLEEKE